MSESEVFETNQTGGDQSGEFSKTGKADKNSENPTKGIIQKNKVNTDTACNIDTPSKEKVDKETNPLSRLSFYGKLQRSHSVSETTKKRKINDTSLEFLEPYRNKEIPEAFTLKEAITLNKNLVADLEKIIMDYPNTQKKSRK